MRSRLGSTVLCLLVAFISTLYIRNDVATGVPEPGKTIDEINFVVRPYLQLGDAIDSLIASTAGNHHPGFNSSKAHFNDQQMRLLADLFEARGVDVVFAGHVHNYQRTFPLRFTVDVWSDGRPLRDENRVPGRWILDKSFDGQAHTRPQGVIYLITGAGGNTLYNPEQQDDPSSWQSFTQKFISKVNSLTLADVSGTTLTVRQVSDTGIELDRFVVTK